jgi:hypothetical protein
MITENDKLEAVVAYCEVRVGIYSQGITKTTKKSIRITGLQAEI